MIVKLKVEIINDEASEKVWREELGGEFSKSEYETYLSRCRETALSAAITGLEIRLKREGWTHGEIARVYADKVLELLKEKP